MHRDVVHQQVHELLGTPIERARPETDLSGQPWLTVKYATQDPDDWHGVIPATLADGRRVAIKVNPAEGIGQTLIPWIQRQFGIRLPRPYFAYASTAETRDTGGREAAIYESGTRLTTTTLGHFFDGREHLLILPWLSLRGLDASGAQCRWDADDIDRALRELAAMQHELSPPAGLPARGTTATVAGDADLWAAVVDDAADRELITAAAARRRLALITSIHEWHPAKDSSPTVVAHNDFNPRNVGFDADRVVALDWELARLDCPQRDAVELLTFAVPGDASREFVRHRLETHRRSLGEDAGPYYAAVAAQVRVQAIDRCGMQLIFGAAFDLPYQQHIQATVDRLCEMFGGLIS